MNCKFQLLVNDRKCTIEKNDMGENILKCNPWNKKNHLIFKDQYGFIKYEDIMSTSATPLPQSPALYATLNTCKHIVFTPNIRFAKRFEFVKIHKEGSPDMFMLKHKNDCQGLCLLDKDKIKCSTNIASLSTPFNPDVLKSNIIIRKKKIELGNHDKNHKTNKTLHTSIPSLFSLTLSKPEKSIATKQPSELPSKPRKSLPSSIPSKQLPRKPTVSNKLILNHKH